MVIVVGSSSSKISHWKSYNQALVNRGSLTVWVEQAVIQGWYSDKHHGRRGRGLQFSDRAIETSDVEDAI